jgi:hypothetical protein
MNLLKNVKITRISNAVAAGTTAVTPTHVDMQDYEGVQFIVLWGTITTAGVQSVKAQQGTISDDSDMADLLGSSVTVADSDDNKATVIDIWQPEERYVRPYISRATQNAVIDGVLAIQYRGRKAPITQPTSVQGNKQLASPIEGTA